MKAVIILLLTLGSVQLAAQPRQQKGSIHLNIINEHKKPVADATVELLISKDSLLFKTSLSANDGAAAFENIPYNAYLLRVSAVNYTTTFTALITIDSTSNTRIIKDLVLTSKPLQMQGVTVVAKKPFIQKLNDRIVVNVESSIMSAGSSALEVLERSPGISVDQNDVISLRGRQFVSIMIDGKPTPMSGADLANYLKGLPANAIERIDIITNPSAKYDAAGNSGIIDIRMKKDQRMGSNGTFTAGYGKGVHPKANAGTTFNYRQKNVNIFGNYNYSYRKMMNKLTLNRNFYQDGVFEGADDKINDAQMPFKTNTIRAGADYFAGKKNIIGFVVNSTFNKFDRINNNNSDVFDRQRQKAFTFKTLATNDDRFNNTVANINFKHNFDSAGRELTADADYGWFHSASMSTTATKYYNLNGTSKQPDYILSGDQDGKLTLKTAKADYVNPLKKGGRFETGIKTSVVTSDNDAKFFDVSAGTPQNDMNKTNHFLYTEKNKAGYFNYSKNYKKLNWQVGLRGEHTQVSTQQLKGNIQFDTSYFQWFPSGFVNYKFNEDKTLGASVSRRINRPGYNQLNPFLFLIDVTTYATGNPGLLPELSWSYEINYTAKKLNFALGYSHTKNPSNMVIAKFNDAFPNLPRADNVTVQIPVNLSSSDYVGLSINAPVKINSWWNMVNNANIYYNHFNGNLGGSVLNNGKPAVDIKTNNTFSFKKGWTAELLANFNSGGQYGYMNSKPQWGLGTGVQKTVLKNKGTLRLNMSDIFWTNRPRATITFKDKYIENWNAYRDSRVANLSFTYRFGNNKVAAARKRATASEEESRRAGGGN